MRRHAMIDAVSGEIGPKTGPAAEGRATMQGSDGRIEDIPLDRGGEIPLHRQLRRHFTRMLDDNRLGDGDYLPSTRELAERLGINRLTALRAFQAMHRAGIVRVQPGRGYYVAKRQDQAMTGGMPRELFGAPATYEAHPESAFSETVRSARDMPLSFAVGYPDISMLPLKQIRRLFARWSDVFAGGDLAYQAPGGHPMLRQQLWRYLEERGIAKTDDRELLVTNGAQHALDIFVRTFQKDTGMAATETPAYYGALAVIRLNGYTALPILQDDQGLSVASLAALCKTRRFDFLYTNLTFNNPTGRTLSRQRQWGVPMPFFVHRETGALHPRTLELLETVAQRVEQSGIEAWQAVDAAELLGADAAAYEMAVTQGYQADVEPERRAQRRVEGLENPVDLIVLAL